MAIKTFDGRVVELTDSHMTIQVARGSRVTLARAPGISKSTPVVLCMEPGTKDVVNVMTLAQWHQMFEESPPEDPRAYRFDEDASPNGESWSMIAPDILE